MGAAEYAPDRIRNLGTAGAMLRAVQCAVGGGEKGPAEVTSQKVGDWCRATSERTRLRSGVDHRGGNYGLRWEEKTSVWDRKLGSLGRHGTNGQSERRGREGEGTLQSRCVGGGGGRVATTAAATNGGRGKERTAGRRFHNRGFQSERTLTLAASEGGCKG